MKQEEDKFTGLPENAFRELKAGEVYNPLMSPSKNYPEVNFWSVTWGIACLLYTSVHWRDHSAQYVVKSPILLGGFYRHHVTDILYHTDSRGVTLRIGTNLTSLGIRYIMTYFTVLYFTFQRNDGVAECLHSSRVLPEQM